MPEFTDITIPTLFQFLVSLLFAAPIPTLVIFMKFLPEELLVRAKKTQVVLHMLYMIYVHVHTYTCKLRFQL